MVISKNDLKNILEQWKNGSIGSEEVHKWAEDRYAVSGWETDNEVTNEVLAELDMLNMNLLIKEDADFLLEILNDPSIITGEQAAAKLEEFHGKIDMNKRKRELSSDPLYAPFCK